MAEIIVGLIGVLAGSFIAGYKEIWLDRVRRKKGKEHLAIQVVCTFDSFIQRCADVAKDDGTYHGQLNKDGRAVAQVELPEFKLPEKDVNWQLLPVQTMYDVLSFPNSIDYSNQLIDAAFELSDLPDFDIGFEERQYQYAKLGILASSIATQLRKECALPDIEYVEWNPVETLVNQKASIEEARERQYEAQKKLFESIENDTADEE